MKSNDDEVNLSASTLAALREFAISRGILTNEDDDNDEKNGVEECVENEEKPREGKGNDALHLISAVRNHFEVKDRNEIFRFSFGNNDITFQLKGVKRELGQTLASTGLTLWRAAENLSTFCYENAHLFQGKKSVLELGAGIGVVSILIGMIARDEASLVIASDGDEDTLTLLRQNINDISSKVRTAKVYWGEHQDFLKENQDGFDIIVAADVIYEDEQVIPLLDTAYDLLAADGSFYLAYARRNIPVDRVLEQAAKKGFNWTVIGNCSELREEPIYCLRRAM